MRKNISINFVIPYRNGIDKVFIALVAILLVVTLGMAFIVKEYLFLVSEINKNTMLLKRYQLVIEQNPEMDSAENSLANFQKNLERMATIKSGLLDVRVFLDFIEKSKVRGVRFIKIDYRAKNRVGIVEFESTDNLSVNGMIKKFERSDFFTTVNILQKERANKSSNNDKYTLELRF